LDSEPSNLILAVLTINTSLITSIILLVILLICSALISGAEVALFSLTKSDIDKGIDEKSKPIEIVASLLENPKKLLATILIANNFINIAIVLLFAYLGEFLFYAIETPVLKFLLEVILATFLILLFGEIIPKIYASRNSVKFSTFMARPLLFLGRLFSPLSIPMGYLTVAIQNRLGKQKSNLSVDQLSQALELTNDDNTTAD